MQWAWRSESSRLAKRRLQMARIAQPGVAPPQNLKLSFFRRMGFQICNCLLQLFLSFGISRQRLGLEGRIQTIPDGIHLALEVAGVGSDGEHRVLVRNHD